MLAQSPERTEITNLFPIVDLHHEAAAIADGNNGFPCLAVIERHVSTSYG